MIHLVISSFKRAKEFGSVQSLSLSEREPGYSVARSKCPHAPMSPSLFIA